MSVSPKDYADAMRRIGEAKLVLLDALRYHEHDGHDMPKRAAREALVALGIPKEEQP